MAAGTAPDAWQVHGSRAAARSLRRSRAIESSDNLIRKLQANRDHLQAKYTHLLGLVGLLLGVEKEVAGRILAGLPALIAQVRGGPLAPADWLRRNVAWHSQAEGIDLLHAPARVLRRAAKGPRLVRPVTAAAADAVEGAGGDDKFSGLRAEAPAFVIGAGSWEPIRDLAVCGAGIRCTCGALVFSSLAGDPPFVAYSGKRHIVHDGVIHQKNVCEGFHKCAAESPRHTSASCAARPFDSESEEGFTDRIKSSLVALPGGGFIFPCADPGENCFGTSSDVQAASEDEATILGFIRARELELQTWSARPPVRAQSARLGPFVRRRARLDQEAAFVRAREQELRDWSASISERAVRLIPRPFVRRREQVNELTRLFECPTLRESSQSDCTQS